MYETNQLSMHTFILVLVYLRGQLGSTPKTALLADLLLGMTNTAVIIPRYLVR